MAETPKVEKPADEIANHESQVANDLPVKTIIHEIKPQVQVVSKPSAVDFVSEDDVRRAVGKNEKIFISPKTIITPSARDLGEEKEIFAKI